MGMGFSLWGDVTLLKLDYGNSCTTVNILEIPELYTLNE